MFNVIFYWEILFWMSSDRVLVAARERLVQCFVLRVCGAVGIFLDDSNGPMIV